MRGSVIGREIVIAPARHSNTARKVITFTMGCKVTQPLAPQACLLNKCTVKLEEIFVRGPCCGCYENGDCARQLAFECKWQFWCINSPPASGVIGAVRRIHKGGTRGEGLDKKRAHSGKRFDLVSSLMDVPLRAESGKRLGQDGKEVQIKCTEHCTWRQA